MRIEGNRYRYEKSIKPNENFTYEEILDLVLGDYDY